MKALLDLCRRFEGKRLKAYFCPAGVLTIGFGHTGTDVKKGMVITNEQAEALLRADAEIFVRAAMKLSPVLALPWHADRLAAIADFNFNLGSTRYKASTLKRCIDRGDWEGAKHQLRKWVFGGGRKLPGLVLRREAEAALL
jgi:lysozyme